MRINIPGTVEEVATIVNNTTIGTGGSGGVGLSNATPQPPGSATSGVGTSASRDDHVHAHEANGSTSVKGLVELATDGETASGVAVQGNDSRLNPFVSISFGFDGYGIALTGPVYIDKEIPFDCTIISATLFGDAAGSVVVDIWKDTYANFPPTIADTIVASAPPTLSGAAKSQDTTLTGWTTSISAGDILRVEFDSFATLTRVQLCLKVKRLP